MSETEALGDTERLKWDQGRNIGWLDPGWSLHLLPVCLVSLQSPSSHILDESESAMKDS